MKSPKPGHTRKVVYQWGPYEPTDWSPIIAFWMAFWFLAFMIVGPLTHQGAWWWLDSLNAFMLSVPLIVVCLPTLLTLLKIIPCLVWLVFKTPFLIAHFVYHNPPFRIVEKPVPDLREEYR